MGKLGSGELGSGRVGVKRVGVGGWSRRVGVVRVWEGWGQEVWGWESYGRGIGVGGVGVGVRRGCRGSWGQGG